MFVKKIPEDLSKRFFKIVPEFDKKSVLDLYHEGNTFYTQDIIDELDSLDEKPPLGIASHPFLLFYKNLEIWRSRGTPFLLDAMAREFSNVEMPISKEKFMDEHLVVYRKLTGYDLTSEKREFFVKNFSNGGIPSGVINVDFFRGLLETIMLNEMCSMIIIKHLDLVYAKSRKLTRCTQCIKIVVLFHINQYNRR